MKQLLTFLLTVLMSMVGAKIYAYDIAVENEDGVTIYYNYINDATELEVTYSWIRINTYQGYRNVKILKIPESVVYMGRTRNVTSIDSHTFDGCTELTSISIPSTMKSIGIKAFEGCSGLNKVIVKDIAAWCQMQFDYSGSNNPLNYAHHLYSDENTEIQNLVIPYSVTSIGNGTFSCCYGLTSITIPDNVKDIGDRAFYNCTGLTSITIPNSVTSIGEYAFDYCTGLTSITIPNSVTSIGYYSFANCTGLTSITIPNSVTSIGEYAFINCTGLTSITIPNSVTSIGYCAFQSCTGLTSITIPNSVTSIGENAFGGIDLISVISLISEPFKITWVFTLNTLYNATLYVPTGTIEKYKACEGWNRFSYIEEEIPALPVIYHLTYYIDGTEYKTFEIEEGAKITPEPAPFKETYKFSGWSEIPETMPNHDVTVTGTFTRYFDVGNLTKAINFVMNNSASAEDVALYDLNNNEKMDIGDVILIVKFILNNSDNASSYIEKRVVEVTELGQYTAAQFEVKTAGNVDLRLVKSMEQTHQLKYQQKDANTYTVVVYSLTNQLMRLENGQIIEMGNNSDILSIENVTVATPTGETAYYQTLSATTGIEQIENENGTAVIYDLKGNRLNSEKALDKGIYIVNGKKTVVR